MVRLPKFLLVLQGALVLVLLLEGLIYLRLKRKLAEPSVSLWSSPSSLIEINNKTTIITAKLNPAFGQNEIVDLFNRYSKSRAKLMVEDSKEKLPKPQHGTVASEIDATSREPLFYLASAYSLDTSEVDLYIVPNFKLYLEKEGGAEELSRIISLQLLKAIISSNNSYLFDGKNPLETPVFLVNKMVKEEPLVLVERIIR